METPDRDDLPLGYEQPDLWDRLLAFFCAAGAAALLYFCSFGFLHPDVWADAAIAAGLRPPETISPSLGRIVSCALFTAFGAKQGILAVNLLGFLCGGLSAALFYLTLRELMPAVLSLRSPSRLWAMRLERLVALVGTAAFACAEPVMRAFQSFGETSLQLTMLLAFCRIFLRLLHYGRFSTAYGVLFLLGVLSVETPFGLLLSILALVVTLVARRYAWRPDLRYLNPMLVELSKWRLSVFFALGFALALIADVCFFVKRGGADVLGIAYGEMAVRWIMAYGRTFWDSASFLGWALIAIFAILPFAVAMFNVRRATDDDSFLSFKIGILFAMVFVVSLAPLSTLPHLRFWVWTERPAVTNGLLLAVSCIALAIAFTLSLAVLAFDIWCRDHRRIALQRFPELIEDGAFARQHFHWRWRRTITVVTIALVAMAIVPGRRHRATVRLAGIIRDALYETVSECGGVSVIVTDGSLDDALRLVAAAAGKNLSPISIMSGGKPYERYLRQSVAVNDEERATLALGVSDALRTWMVGQPGRFAQVALQIGFEIWRTRRAQRPPASGFLARMGLSAEEVERGAEVARSLAQRADAAQADGSYARCEDRSVREKFLFVQWRLARLAAIRAEDSDRRNELAKSRSDAALADRLDNLNPELRRVREALNWIRNREGDSLTPREGLRIALERADFALARRYATPILTADPTNPDANFGMGMSYFVEEKYGQAEPYLKASQIRRPEEPAVLNNLAICCYRGGRLDEALEFSRKAFAKLPDAPAVRKTYEEIRKAVDARNAARQPAK